MWQIYGLDSGRMQGSALLRLARTADLAKNDANVRPTTLISHNGFVYAAYSGAYVGGQVHVAGTLPGDSFVVGTAQLRDLANLFDSGSEVLLTVDKENGLRMAGADRNATLRCLPEAAVGLMPMPFDQPSIICRTNTLKAEMELAEQFTSDSPQVPVLTGVRMVLSKDTLVLMAHDGAAGLFASNVPCKPGDHGYPEKLDLSVPPSDIAVGLSLLTEEEHVCISLSGNNILLYNESGIVRTSTLAGQWPDVRGVTQQIERHDVLLESDKLDLVLSGVKALGAEQVIILERAGDAMRVRTKASEMGAFVVDMPQAFPIEQVAFDVHSIRLAAKLSKSITMQIAASASVPTLIKADARRYWITRRVL